MYSQLANAIEGILSVPVEDPNVNQQQRLATFS